MEQKIELFKKNLPHAFFLTSMRETINQYLERIDFLGKGEWVQDISKPGEGNMNFVLRVTTNQRQFILKQARPWVEKYPAIEAPVERNRIEAAFYEKIASYPRLRAYSPDILFTDDQSKVLIMTDLGQGSDYLHLYQYGHILEEQVLQDLVAYLIDLHQIRSFDFPNNLAMRKLNHEHIFRFPFIENNGFDLNLIQPGLAELSLNYKQNSTLTSTIFGLGQRYLERGKILVHGDYYPGCWLSTPEGLKIIDPEFCFPGFAEFDIGMMTGHLLLSGQPNHYVDQLIQLYQDGGGKINEKIVFQMGGLCVLRRILGVAQLPLPYDLSEKESLMNIATNWILS